MTIRGIPGVLPRGLFLRFSGLCSKLQTRIHLKRGLIIVVCFHLTNTHRDADFLVVNMSLRGPFNRAFNQAINAAVTAGITCIVAAGNDNKDAAHMSPASADSAFTVGSVDSEYNRYKSSNYGSRLEIFAPGHKILSCGIDHDTDTTVATGTSMACPHVTGVAAYLMRLEGLKTPKQVCIRLRKLAVKNVVKNIGSPDTPNLFLFNGGGK